MEQHCDKRGEDESPTAKKRKTMPNSSFIWDHFERSEDKKSIACLHCLPLGTTVFAYSGGTSTMTRHLRRKHGIFPPGKSEQDYERSHATTVAPTSLSFFDKADDRGLSTAEGAPAADDKLGKLTASRYLKSTCARHTIQWIQYATAKYTPLQLDADLHTLLKKGNGIFNPQQGAPLVASLMELMHSQRTALQTYFDNNQHPLSLSVHEWAGHGHSVVVVTAHWITTEFEPWQCVLDSKLSIEEFTASDTVRVVSDTVTQWKLQNRLCAITVDPKWDSSMTWLESFPDVTVVPCLFKQVANAMEEVLHLSSPLLEKARRIVLDQSVVQMDRPGVWWTSVEMLQALLDHPSWSDGEAEHLQSLVSLVGPFHVLLTQTTAMATTPPLASLVYSLLHGIVKLVANKPDGKSILPLVHAILENPSLTQVCVLDPRFKSLPFLSPADKQRTLDDIQKLLPPKPTLPGTSTSSWSELYPFDDGHASGDMTMYLETPTASDLVDPLAWWKVHRHVYPDLATLARKFLSVSPCAGPVEELMTLDIAARKRDVPTNLISAYLFVRSAFGVAELVEKSSGTYI
ncbi:hypothetical protein LEN26_014700 [Aphanomyces euteiches]|nr:hypothetical protein LEN26_014700 [Aphanomyces euteiches]